MERKQKKLILICCYFGQFPNYFDLFLNSCRKNKEIDWLIFTDCEKPSDCPDNVIFNHIHFEDLVSLIKQTLGDNIICHQPYKLCDYRPAYGLIFQQDIKEYTYWGFCDIDVIWGDLMTFVADPMQEGYDKIFSYGHLSLCRNTEKVNNAFKLKFSGIDYKYVFSHKLSFGFDEKRGFNKLLDENKFSVYKEDYALDVFFPFIEKKITFSNQINYDKQFVAWNNGLIEVCSLDDKGRLQSKEYAYIHLQKRHFSSHNIKTNKYIIMPTSFSDVESLDSEVFSNFDLETPTMPITKKSFLMQSIIYKLHRFIFLIKNR